MNEELKRLWAEKENILEQMNPLLEKMDMIDDKIRKIKESCSHLNLKTIKRDVNIGGTKHNLTIEECVECGEILFR
jgi:predicted nuclease with TOPRIM domain